MSVHSILDLAILDLGRTLLAIAIAAAAGCAAPAPSLVAPQDPALARPTQIFMASVGARSLDDTTAWEAIDEPVSIGFESASVGDPLGFEVGLFYARDSTDVLGVDVSSNFLEVAVGGRGTFGNGPLFPYAGAGVSLILADVTGEASGGSVSDDDVGLGLYGHGGVLFRVGERFFLGVDLRVVTGSSVEIFGIETDADYTQLALVLGWGG